jgi:hypothetical protein
VSRELLPIALGLGVGAVLAGLRPSLSVAAGAVVAVPLGFLVTVVTGEFELGWEYLLVDVPLVAVSSVAGSWIVRALARDRPWPTAR